MRNLKRSGFSEEDLKTAYLSLVRPVFDYTSAVYHPLLNADQSTRLERMQKRALKIISGQGSNYAESIEKLGIDTLETRRLALVDSFLDKAIVNTRFSQRWFLVKEKNPLNTRHEQKYKEFRCNTERSRRNPLNFYRSRLNDKLKNIRVIREAPQYGE